MAVKEYDFIMVGGGVAGLVATSGASQLGARVAVVEKHGLGGDCLRTGCVPTKRREAGALTNESALELKALPASIVIIGGGPRRGAHHTRLSDT
ncbi:MAG TPA: FAD-dependent oxidoreductase [Thermodesulfobacteriota bacterium]